MLCECGNEMKHEKTSLTIRWSGRRKISIKNLTVNTCLICKFYEIDPSHRRLVYEVGREFSSYLDEIDIKALKDFKKVSSEYDGLIFRNKEGVILIKT